MQEDIKNVNHTKNFAGNAAAAFLLFVYMSEDLTLIFYISKTNHSECQCTLLLSLVLCFEKESSST
jgi:hypothetical protein